MHSYTINDATFKALQEQLAPDDPTGTGDEMSPVDDETGDKMSPVGAGTGDIVSPDWGQNVTTFKESSKENSFKETTDSPAGAGSVEAGPGKSRVGLRSAG